MVFNLKNTVKDFIMTEEDEEQYRNNTNCRFCQKIIESDKVRDHCHLTGKNTGPAHSISNMYHRNKEDFFQLSFTILVIMIVIYFLKG